MLIDLLASSCLVAGTFFVLVSAIGLLRLPDVYSRLHAATKSTTFGAGLLLLAAMLVFGRLGGSVLKELLALLFLFLTAPVGGHMIARTAYLIGVGMWEATKIDELTRHGSLAAADSRSETD